MRSPLAVVVALLVTALASPTTHAEPSQYLCVVEHAAGLAYDKQAKAWGAAPFLAGAKFVFRKLTDDDRDHEKGKWWAAFEHSNANWALFEFEKPNPQPLMWCFEPPDYFSSFQCHPLAFDGDFDKDSRRFEIVSRGGYIAQGFWEQFRREHPEEYERSRKNDKGARDPAKPDPLFIGIGTCSPS
jgi:hypothetical protein